MFKFYLKIFYKQNIIFLDYSNTPYLISVLQNRCSLNNLGFNNNSDLISTNKVETENFDNNFLLSKYKLNETNSTINDNLLEKLSVNFIDNNETNIESAIKKLLNLSLDEFVVEKVLAFKNILSKTKKYFFHLKFKTKKKIYNLIICIIFQILTFYYYFIVLNISQQNVKT